MSIAGIDGNIIADAKKNLGDVSLYRMFFLSDTHLNTIVSYLFARC